MVADMTPAYALLSEGRLTRMAGIGGDVRFLYLIRDPVERLWSHVRMIAAQRAARTERPRGGRRMCCPACSSARRRDRGASDYAAAIGKLARARGPRRVMVAVTEEMFTAAGLRDHDVSRAAGAGGGVLAPHP